MAVSFPLVEPMPLMRMADPWNNPDWLFELKYDGFRAIAYVGERVRLVSRRSFSYRRFQELEETLRQTLAGRHVILDGEIISLDSQGIPRFYDLMYHRRRGMLCFAAFDLLWLDGTDLRARSLVERKRQLRELLPHGGEVIYVHHFDGRGTDLFREVCRRDLEGIVAKFKRAPYGLANSWVKVKNPNYSQMVDRHLLFRSESA